MLKQNIPDEQTLDIRLRPLFSKENNTEQTIADCKTLLAAECRQRNISPTPNNLLNEALTEYWFAQPSNRLLDAQSSVGGKAFSYKLGRKTIIPALACTHITDIGLVFGNTTPAFHGDEPRVQQLVDELQSYWGAFAYIGNPNGDLINNTETMNWPSYNQNERTFLFFNHYNTHIDSLGDKSVNFWSRITNQQLASF